MTVRICNVTFSDWVSLPFQDGWTDTFIFHINAKACIPPFHYEEPLRRMASRAHRKRPGASLWVQVDSPGELYLAEVRKSLRGLQIPHAVTHTSVELEYLDFSFRPKLFHAPSQHPPLVAEEPSPVSPEELRCLQVLGRMEKGNEHEIASLSGLSVDITRTVLARLEEDGLVIYKTGSKKKRGKSGPVQIDLFPLWHTRPKGLSMALRSWGIPKGMQFTSRMEENRRLIGYEHRHIARVWPEWLKSAWPHAEIWTGWSEVQIPGLSVIPDGLAWGSIQGYETLFWLEVGDGHKSRDKITDITTRRLEQARELCERSGVRLVYTQLSTNWVHEAARWACVQLSRNVAVVMGNQRRFGELPILEWGRVSNF